MWKGGRDRGKEVEIFLFFYYYYYYYYFLNRNSPISKMLVFLGSPAKR